MVYDEKLADRVRAALPDHASVEERTMFGGLTFVLDGHMCCGLNGRVGATRRVGAGPRLP